MKFYAKTLLLLSICGLTSPSISHAYDNLYLADKPNYSNGQIGSYNKWNPNLYYSYIVGTANIMNSGNSSIIGNHNSLNSTSFSFILGNYNYTDIPKGGSDITLGSYSKIINSTSTGIFGYTSTANNATNGYIIGNGNSLDAENTSMVGYQLNSNSSNSVIMGNNSSSYGTNNITIGNHNQNYAPGSVNMGSNNNNSVVDGISLGNFITAGNKSALNTYTGIINNNPTYRAITIGSLTSNDTSDSISLGSFSQDDTTSDKIGYSPSTNQVPKDLFHLFPATNNSDPTLSNSTEAGVVTLNNIRNNINSLNADLTSYYNALTLREDASKLKSLKTAVDYDIANLQKPATTDAVTYSAWQSTLAPLIIGNPKSALTRQIIGVSAGTKDTDAVNVAQLRQVTSMVNNALTSTGELNKNLNYIHVNPNTITPYTNSMYASNILTLSGAGAPGAIALGYYSQANNYNSIALGTNTTALNENNIVIGNNSSDLGSTLLGSNPTSLYTNENLPTSVGAVYVGNAISTSIKNTNGNIVNTPITYRRIAEVAGGVLPHDAVNLAQLQAVADYIGATPEKVSQFMKNKELGLGSNTLADQIHGLAAQVEKNAQVSASNTYQTGLNADAANQNLLSINNLKSKLAADESNNQSQWNTQQATNTTLQQDVSKLGENLLNQQSTLGTLNNQVQYLNTTIPKLETNILQNKGNIATLQNTTQNLADKTANLANEIKANQDQLTNQSKDLTNLQNTFAANKTAQQQAIAKNLNSITANTQALKTLDPKIQALEKASSDHNTELNNLATTVHNNTGAIHNNSNAIQNNITKIATNEQNINANKTNIATNQNNIAALQQGWNLATGSTSQAIKASHTVTIKGDNNLIVSQTNNGQGAVLSFSLNSAPTFAGPLTVGNSGNKIIINPVTGINMGNTGITGLKAGTIAANSTDAITGAQLYNFKSNLSANTQAIEALRNQLSGSTTTNPDHGSTVPTVPSDQDGIEGEIRALNTGSAGTVVYTLNNQLIGLGKDNNYYLLSDLDKQGNPKANAEVIDPNKIVLNLVGPKTSYSQPIRLTNVANGVNNTDAVNMSQLNGLANAIGINENNLKQLKGNNTILGQISSNKAAIGNNAASLNNLSNTVAANKTSAEIAAKANADAIQNNTNEIKNNAANIATNTRNLSKLQTDLPTTINNALTPIKNLANSNEAKLNNLAEQQTKNTNAIATNATNLTKYKATVNNSLEQLGNTLDSKVKALQTNLSNSQEQAINALKTANHQAMDNLDKKLTTVQSNLSNSLNSLDEKLDKNEQTQKATNEAINKSLAELGGNLGTVADNLKNANTEISNNHHRIDELNTKYNNVQALAADNGKLAAANQGAINTLKPMVNANQANIAKLTQALDGDGNGPGLKATVADLQNSTTTNTNTLKDLTTKELPTLQKNITTNQNSINNINSKLTKATDNINTNTQNINNLTHQQQANTSAINNLSQGWQLSTQDFTSNLPTISTIKATNQVLWKTGKNLVINQSTQDNLTTINLGLNPNPNFNSITIGSNNNVIILNPQTGLNLGGLGITNLKPGAISKDSTEAVNGSQLYNLNNTANELIGKTKANADAIARINNILGSGGSSSSASTTPSSTGGLEGSIHTLLNGTAGNVIYTSDTGAPVAKAGNTYYLANQVNSHGIPDNNAQALPTESLSLSLVNTQGSTSTPIRLTNVAPGKNTTDAVNYGQLSAVNQAIGLNPNNLQTLAQPGNSLLDQIANNHQNIDSIEHNLANNNKLLIDQGANINKNTADIKSNKDSIIGNANTAKANKDAIQLLNNQVTDLDKKLTKDLSNTQTTLQSKITDLENSTKANSQQLATNIANTNKALANTNDNKAAVAALQKALTSTQNQQAIDQGQIKDNQNKIQTNRADLQNLKGDYENLNNTATINGNNIQALQNKTNTLTGKLSTVATELNNAKQTLGSSIDANKNNIAHNTTKLDQLTNAVTNNQLANATARDKLQNQITANQTQINNANHNITENTNAINANHNLITTTNTLANNNKNQITNLQNQQIQTDKTLDTIQSNLAGNTSHIKNLQNNVEANKNNIELNKAATQANSTAIQGNKTLITNLQDQQASSDQAITQLQKGWTMSTQTGNSGLSKVNITAGKQVLWQVDNNLSLNQTATPEGSLVKLQLSPTPTFNTLTIGSSEHNIFLSPNAGLNMGNLPITNLAPGREAGDAVNYGQFKNLEKTAANLNNALTNLRDELNGTGHASTTTTPSTDQGGLRADIDKLLTGAKGTVIYTNKDMALAEYQGKYYYSSNLNSQGQPIDPSATVNTKDIKLSLVNPDGNNSTTAPVILTNVADGVTANDAVNMSQLNNLASAIGITPDNINQFQGNHNLLNRITTNEHNLTTLDNNLKALNSQVTTNQQAANNAYTTLKNTVDKNTANINTNANKLTKLGKDLDDAKNDLDNTIKSTVATAKADLQGEIAKNSSLIQSNQGDNLKLTKDLKALGDNLDDYKTTLSGKLSAIDNNLGGLKNNLHTLQGDLSNTNNNLNNLNNAFTDYKTQTAGTLNHLETTVNTNTQAINNQKTALTNLGKKVDNINGNVTKNTTDLNNLQNSLSNTSNNLQKLTEQVNGNNGVSKQVTQLQNTLDKFQPIINKNATDIANTQKQVNTNLGAIKTLGDKLTQNQRNIELNTNDLKDLKNNVANNLTNIGKNTDAIQENKTLITKNTDQIKLNTKDISNFKNIINGKIQDLDKGWNFNLSSNGANYSKTIKTGDSLQLITDNNLEASLQDGNFYLGVSKTPTFNSLKLNLGNAGTITLNNQGLNMNNLPITNLGSVNISDNGNAAATTGQLYNLQQELNQLKNYIGGPSTTSNPSIPTTPPTPTTPAPVINNNLTTTVDNLLQGQRGPVVYTDKYNHPTAPTTTTSPSLSLVNSSGSITTPIRLSNVAKAINNTDAVNWGQLKDELKASGIKYTDPVVNYDSAEKKQITLGGINSNTDGKLRVPEGVVITNLKAGTEGTDAVNLNQLNETTNKLASAVTNQLNTFGNALEKTNKELTTATSMSAALAALSPMPYVPGEKSQILAGIGYYRGNGSLAIGLSHYSTADIMWKTGIALSNNGKVLFNAGLSWRLGSQLTKHFDPTTSNLVLANQATNQRVEQLENENQQLKTAYNQLAKEHEAMKKELDFLLTKIGAK